MTYKPSPETAQIIDQIMRSPNGCADDELTAHSDSAVLQIPEIEPSPEDIAMYEKWYREWLAETSPEDAASLWSGLFELIEICKTRDGHGGIYLDIPFGD